MKAFTLIEVLITIFLIFILSSFVVSIGLNFYRSQQLETHSQGVLQTLRRAQLKAMSVELDSSFGVYLTNDNYTLFKGNSYITRDTQYDEIFDLPQIITVDGLLEIIFLKLEGIPRESPGYCGGECIPCDGLGRQQCRQQEGCFWFFGNCWGTCTTCDSYGDPSGCQGQLGCTWYPATRGGDIILNSDGDSETININEIGRANLEL